MAALDDALHQLRQHRGLARVGDPIQIDGTIRVEIDIPVELPSRSRAKGISATGVRAIETCVLVFTSSWPLRAPRPYLRADFPLKLPHINPHTAGKLVSPCVFEGSLDELLHRFGLNAIVDQLIDWLGKAAGGILIDLAQGWEPTRRDSCPSMIVFSAERLCASAPIDGSILTVSAGYVAVESGLFAFLASDFDPRPQLVFNQAPQDEPGGNLTSGSCAAFIARAPVRNEISHIAAEYLPEMVHDLESLLERAAELGINCEALARVFDDYYRRSIFVGQNPHTWTQGLYAIVILVVQRPVPLIGAPGRSLELLPYVVRCNIDTRSPINRTESVHPAFHAHALSPDLLSRTSNIPSKAIAQKVVLLGCGSVGSKIGLHLGRAGFGALTFVDNERMSPHNHARHALVTEKPVMLPVHKAELMKATFETLSHTGARAIDADVVSLLTDHAQFADVVSEDTTLVVDATASLQVLAAASKSAPLATRSSRLSRAVLYGTGRCAVLMLEGLGRAARVDDLASLLFERCRTNPQIRAAIAGDSTEPARVFVGDNCRSLTTPMSDAVVSRAASLMAIQIEHWLVRGFPASGQLCIGVADAGGLGMNWITLAAPAAVSIPVTECGGWEIRILPAVVDAIAADVRRWGELETGGALIGRISYECRTIIIAGLIDAPPDSVRERARFILGISGLALSLRRAHADSLGYLAFVGTWHSHPLGGQHSSIDRETLRAIAKDFIGQPAVSMVWTPTGLRCAVDQWS